MTTGEIGDVFYRVYVLAMQIGGPILIAAMGIGIVVSILQAATQIHEQTLSFVPKLVIIGIILVSMGNRILMLLQDFSRMIFSMIAGG